MKEGDRLLQHSISTQDAKATHRLVRRCVESYLPVKSATILTPNAGRILHNEPLFPGVYIYTFPHKWQINSAYLSKCFAIKSSTVRQYSVGATEDESAWPAPSTVSSSFLRQAEPHTIRPAYCTVQAHPTSRE